MTLNYMLGDVYFIYIYVANKRKEFEGKNSLFYSLNYVNIYMQKLV